ncbi:MAG: hypothetical protein Q9207_000340 [Kuettlingeria erythrocarpa]
MDLDREDSPKTIHGDSPEVIDLDSTGHSFDITADDFMTDEEFNSIYLSNQEPDPNSATTQYKVLDSFNSNGDVYRQGTAAELTNGDFVRIAAVLEDHRTGLRFFRGSLYQKTETEPLEVMPYASSVTLPAADAIRMREIVVTNEAYPMYSFKEEKNNRSLQRDSARERCRLVCRWKILMVYRTEARRKARVSMCISRMRTEDSDHNYRARDGHLRQEWRGATIRGGRCHSWLPGEKDFDVAEHGRTRGVDILGFHRQSTMRVNNTVDLTGNALQTLQAQRYMFGDAFCGAGGASRGAKAAGLRIDWGFDYDPAAIESYGKNFFAARCEVAPADVFITSTDGDYVVDVLHISPPCQTFSPIHVHTGKDDDQNSSALFAVGELLKKTKPRVVTLENTFGLMQNRWKDWLYSMIRVFTALGFSVRWTVLNLAEYGLPQARRRLILIASCFKELKAEISSALVNTTRTAGQIAKEDLAFQRSINPEVDRLLQEQSNRLLALVRDLNKSATAGSATAPPVLKDAESVDDGWRGIVDIIDNLLEKADACLDEYSGVIKKLTPARQNEQASADAKKPLAKREYRNQNLLKPQRLFRRAPKNDDDTPFKPLLTSKPNALIPLEESLTLAPQPDGFMQYKQPYEAEIVQANYPAAAYVQSDPIPFLPFESTDATWVDTPEAVQDMLQHLRKATEIAVDVEHHDLHSYVGLVSLLQISTRERDWIVDTLVPWREDLQVLNEVFTDPQIIKVLHGSNCDIVWLQRDLGLYIVGLFDTYHASRLLGYPKHSLAHLLQRHVGFEADKRYQMADWRMRPLPKQMYDYARSDTHFLLYIFDHIRNELLAKSLKANANDNLIDEIHESSKREALQRYERFFYDAKNGTGMGGWNNMLTRSSDRFDRQQFAVLRAVHQWRDRVAREEDESTHHILTNRALILIAKEMPTELPRLQSCCQPSHFSTKKRAHDLLALVRTAKVEGVNGPELHELVVPRGHIRVNNLNSSSLAASALSTNHVSASLESSAGRNSATTHVSQFWGATIGRIMPDRKRVQTIERNEPRLALPLPLLTAQVFETKTLDEPPILVRRTAEPGAQVEHQYTKKRKSQEEDVFVVKRMGGSKKRKTAETQDGPEPIAVDDMVRRGNGMADQEPGNSENELHHDELEEGGPSKSQQRRRRKELLQDAHPSAASEVDGRVEKGEMAAFDYENAPSVLHARKEHGGSTGAKRGIDPYSKSLDAPKGMRKVQREVPGRSMTYKS